ncbi:MAG: histidine--tRNA ligase [Candidatus Aminicenantales bacterium]
MKGKKRIAAIKGTKDILPQEARSWQWVEAEAKRIFELYGYREIRTPIFEATELFKKGTGQTSDIVIKEMYTFQDKGGRSLTLRPEYTPSVVRAIIEKRIYLKPQPLRFYYIGPMFRYDKPQKGRYRQFHQMDIEVFGEQDAAIDAEIVEMADFLLHRLRVSDIETLVNSVGCKQCRPLYLKKLRQQAEATKDILCPDCQRKIVANPLRIFDCKVESCREASAGFPYITDYLCSDCRLHFQRFRSYLDLFRINYRVEPRLVRGIDYYTKTTFEIISSRLGAQDAILGGGRYDNMMHDFGGPDMCGIGFAVGMERLISLVPFSKKTEKFLYVAYLGEEAKRQAMVAVRKLRQKGIECLMEYKERSLKSQLTRANKLEASWVLIVGEDELRKQKFQLKDMSTGLQQEVNLDNLLSILQAK